MRILRLLPLLLLFTLRVVAQEEAPPQLTRLNVLWHVRDDQTVTVMYHLTMATEPDVEMEVPLSVLVPGRIMDIQYGNPHIFGLLDEVTVDAPPYINPPCELSPILVIGHGPGPDPYVGTQAEVTHDRTLNSDAGHQVAQFTLRLKAEPLVGFEHELYTQRRHDSPLIQITYQALSENLLLPLNHGNLLADTPYRADFNAYVLAEAAYTVDTAPLITVDPALLRTGVHEVRATLRHTMRGGEPSIRSLFNTLVTNTLSEAEAASFVLYYAAPTEPLLAEIVDNYQWEEDAEDDLLPLLEQAPYLTRLHSETRLPLSPDLIFSPAPETPDTILRLEDRIDPAHLYGCTTEALYDPALEAAMPDNRVYVKDLRAYVPLPEGWTLFEFDNRRRMSDVPLYAAAPETLAADEVYRYAGGYVASIKAPVLALEHFRAAYTANERGYGYILDISADPVARGDYDTFIAAVGANSFLWYWPHSDTAPLGNWRSDEQGYAHGVKLSMVAPLEDYADHAELYDNFLRYLSGYQYFTHAELRHTLFLGGLSGHIQIGYPEGWRTLRAPDFGRLILPEGQRDPADSPYVRVIPLSRQEMEDGAFERFGFTQTAWDAGDDTPLAFEEGQRRGYRRLGAGTEGSGFIVEFSAPAAAYDEHAAILRLMAQAMRSARYTGS